MPGTVKGGKLAAQTNKERYGKEFYVVIGAAGGRKSRGGQFSDKSKARFWGSVGGRKSRRGNN